MKSINIHEAKTSFSKLIESVMQGFEITIAKAGKPVAKLTPIAPPLRKPGKLKNKISIAADFDTAIAIKNT